MSNNDENNSHPYITNKSAKNVSNYSHQKNKSFNFISDPPSAVITVQLHSANSNQNSKSKEKNNKSTKNIYNAKILNIKNNINESKTEPEKKEEIHLYSNQIKNNSNSKDSNTDTNIIINKKKESSNSYSSTKIELEQNLKDINNYRAKLSKINEQYSSNTPKQLSSVNKVIVEGEGDQGNILVKKNLKLGAQRTKNSPDNKDRINEIKNNRNDNNKNDYVKYVNNDKYNINGNILNMTQNNKKSSKYVLIQSKSFTKVEKKNSAIGLPSPTHINSNNLNNINNNSNSKRNHNFNYINYNNYKNNCNKRKELTVLTKNNNNNNTFRNNNKTENINNINSFMSPNISTSPNSNNHIQSFFNNISKINYSKKNGYNKTPNNINRSKNMSNGNNRSNNTSNSNSNINNSNVNNGNKNIFFMKPIQQKKRSSYGKNHEIYIINKDNTTNQSSLKSKQIKENNYKTTLDSSFLSDVFNKNIDNPEELHYFYVKILQNGKEISKKFEIDNT